MRITHPQALHPHRRDTPLCARWFENVTNMLTGHRDRREGAHGRSLPAWLRWALYLYQEEHERLSEVLFFPSSHPHRLLISN